MKLHVRKRRVKKRYTHTVHKFLFIPLIFRGKFFWLKRVIIEKSFNGYKLTIIGVNE